MAIRGLKFPPAFGPEVPVKVIAARPNAEGAPVGKTMLVFPKI